MKILERKLSKLIAIIAVVGIMILVHIFIFPSHKEKFISFIQLQKSYIFGLKEIPFITIINNKTRNTSFLKGTLKSAGRALTIYLHYHTDFISKSILNGGTWEHHLIIQFEEYIKKHPGIQILDAGCNIGVYSLTAAALGTSVVSVDANSINTDRLTQSLLVNNLTENVTICLNALNNHRKDFIMSFEANNVGGQFVIENKNSSRRVKGIIMDDLIPLFDKKRPVLIKMDIQGKEIETFQNATRFFQELNVTLIMIEWEWIKNMKGIEGLMSFLRNRSYKPYAEYNKVTLLNYALYKSWPYDIMWIKE